MSKDIKNILQEKFEDFEPQPSRDLWAGIEAEIQQGRRIAPVWRYAAAAAVAIVLAVVFWPGRPANQESISPMANLSDTLKTTLPPQSPAQLPEVTMAEAAIQTREKTDPSKTQDKSTNQKPATRNQEPQTSSPLPAEEAKPKIQLAAVSSPAPLKILVEEVSPVITTLPAPFASAPEKRNILNKDIKLSELDPITMVSLASETLDELGVRSPVHYQLEKQEELKMKRSHFELILGKFSFTHTTHRDM